MNYHHLSIEERSCIRKYYVDGLSYREIARDEGVDKSAVRNSVLCGIEAMKKYLRKNL